MAKRKKMASGAGWSLEKTCPRCGNTESRCRCAPEDSAEGREGATPSRVIVRLRIEKRRGKPVTVLEAETATDAFRDVVKDLKGRLGTGGTVKGNLGELQGEHRARAREALAAAGFEVRG